MNQKNTGPFTYDQTQVLKKFTDTQPAVMLDRINKANWSFYYEPAKANLPFKERFKNFIAFITGCKRPFDYKNYML